MVAAVARLWRRRWWSCSLLSCHPPSVQFHYDPQQNADADDYRCTLSDASQINDLERLRVWSRILVYDVALDLSLAEGREDAKASKDVRHRRRLSLATPWERPIIPNGCSPSIVDTQDGNLLLDGNLQARTFSLDSQPTVFCECAENTVVDSCEHPTR
nr:hypothetical protein CFP56_44242 [Quercus suber]